MLRKSVIAILLWLVFCAFQSDRRVPIYAIPTLTVETGRVNGFDLSVYKKSSKVRMKVGNHESLNIRYVDNVDSLYIEPKEAAPKLIILPLWADNQRFDLLVRVKQLVKHTFTYHPSPADTHVVVMGGFNDWSRTALPMSDNDGDGVLERTVYLRPERHEYKFVVDRDEVIDPANPVFVSNNIGGWNSVLDLSQYQEQPAGMFVKSTINKDTLLFSFLPNQNGVEPSTIMVLFDNTVLNKDRVRQKGEDTLAVNILGLANGLLRITGLDAVGRVIPENDTILKGGRPLHPSRDPDDWHFAILYNLMVDRFLDGDPLNTKRTGDPDIHPLADFHGGDFAGIIRKLKEGYFSDLGINTIWITPVGLLPEKGYVEYIPPNRKYSGYHGYWPIAPRTLDPRFGTEEELRQLVKIAHDQGIKVILDFVSNHVHKEHSYFKEHRDWFGSMYLPNGEVNIRNWSEETRLTTWFDTFIPSYDFMGSQEAIDQVVDDAIWWLETFDFDGFRQDAVKHVPHRFWKRLTARMKEQFPDKDFYQIGESFGSDDLIKSYVNPAELSSQFNFSIYFNARGPFSADKADFSHIMKVIKENIEFYSPVHLMGNITSSHDQVRFMAFADGQVSFNENGTERAFNDPPGSVQNSTSYLKMANFTAFNMVLPGVPVIYYGDEIGLMGAGDPDNRRVMRFDPDLSEDETKLKNTVSTLTKLRRLYPSFAIGDFVPLLVEGPVMIFVKTYFDETILVAFNHCNDTNKITLDVPFHGMELVSLLNDDIITLNSGKASLILEPYSHQIWEVR